MSDTAAARKLRMGMVGGGRGAFIGAVHRSAAALDGRIELVCGAFSSDPDCARASGAELFLPPARCYESFAEMLRVEAGLPIGQRMDFVSIVTPNHLHAPMATAALHAGFPVLCDKPLALSLREALDLRAVVRASALPFALTHNYTGYPLVKEARALVRGGCIGAVRKVVVEYPQGWLATRIEASGHRQASWRTDPARAGLAGCVGDIGTHAENLAEYVTGLRIRELAADLTSFVDGRPLDDDANVLLRFEGGAKGALIASQIAVGEENNLSLRVWGSSGGIEWHQREPNSLWLKSADQPTRLLRTGSAGLSPTAAAATRLPPGHPEGYIEAFANIYRAFAAQVAAHVDGLSPPSDALDHPTIDDGVRGMAFIEAVVASSRANAAWTPLAADAMPRAASSSKSAPPVAPQAPPVR